MPSSGVEECSDLDGGKGVATLKQRRWTVAEQAQQLLGGLATYIAGDCRNARTMAFHDAIDAGQSIPPKGAWKPYMSLMSLLSDEEVLLLIEGVGTNDPERLRRVIASAITKDVAAMLPYGTEGINVRLCGGPDCQHADDDSSHTLRVYYGPQA